MIAVYWIVTMDYLTERKRERECVRVCVYVFVYVHSRIHVILESGRKMIEPKLIK